MTLGAGEALLALATSGVVSAAMLTGALTAARSPLSEEAARGRFGALATLPPSDASPTHPVTDDASANANPNPQQVFVERPTIANTTTLPKTRPRSAHHARTTLAMHADLWQGLQICTSAGS